MSTIKNFEEIHIEKKKLASPWELRVIQSDQCLSYVAWNQDSKEAVLIDPKVEDFLSYEKIKSSHPELRFVAIIDTHTHADHVSCAYEFSEKHHIPIYMHKNAPSKRAHFKVENETFIPLQATPLHFFHTPGHTPDSMTVLWGPFVFGGDTLLFGDVGRDDLPGGDPKEHFESLEKLKSLLPKDAFILPGHDPKGGRTSTFEHQKTINSSLTQSKEDYIKEAEEFDFEAPTLLKKSLRENFK